MKPIRNAALVAIGSELLGEERVDTNSLTVSRLLAGYGVRTVEKRVLGDDVMAVADALKSLIGRVDLVVTTGGLGPTADDVTREAVALATGRELEYSREAEGWIREVYARFDREMPTACRTMARVLPGARVLRNSRGTAPGLLAELGGAVLAVFPGVPWEMEAMLERDLAPELERRNGHLRRVTRTLLLSGVIESEVEEKVRPLYDRFGRENVTILASCGLVRLVLTAEGPAVEAGDTLDEMESAFGDLVDGDLVGVNVRGIAEAALETLRMRGETVASAESCTGGLIGTMLTDVPGSSNVFVGGVIAYSNAIKHGLLGVPERILEDHGAVSEPVARAMAEGARRRLGADWAIGVTGIAGPGGGTDEKPVGLVHWAVAGGPGIFHRSRRLPGTREVVRRFSANLGLDLLLRAIKGTV